MLKKWKFSIDQLREAVSYDHETGRLTWLSRPLAHFPNERIRRTVNSRLAGTPAFAQISQYGYAVGCIFQQKIMAHHAAFALVTGRWPEEIDHINGKRSDNRWENLREVSRIENRHNQARPKNNKSGFLGVCWNVASQKWTATISVEKKQVWLGAYADKAAAIAARVEANQKYGFHENHGRAPEREAA